MNSFDTDFTDFVFSRQDAAYESYIESDPYYQEVSKYLELNREKYNNILNKLSEEDKEFFIEYQDKLNKKTACTDEHLYMAGVKDCVKLMKKVGLVIFEM